MPKTQGYHLASAPGKGGRIGRTPLLGDSRQFLNWTGSRPAKPVSQVMAETRDRMLRTRPLAALTTQVANARHDTDMYRIGGGAVGPVKSGFESQARVKPRISFVKGPDGKIVAEKTARTFQKSNVPWRPELPVGGPGRKPKVSSYDYPEWTDRAISYNRAVSRQQMLQSDNPVLNDPKNVKSVTLPKRILNQPHVAGEQTKFYVPRGGELGTRLPANDMPTLAKHFNQVV
jgi:hypothetical protein